MAKKRKKRTESATVALPTAPLVDHGAWRWPDAPSRGRLDPLEEMDIAHAPRPVKDDQQLAEEHATRAARADTESTPDLVPLKLHAQYGGNLQDTTSFRRYVFGDLAETEEGRRWRLLLADLARTNKFAHDVLVLRFADHWSYEDIGKAIARDRKWVAAVIEATLLGLEHAYAALYAHGGLDG